MPLSLPTAQMLTPIAVPQPLFGMRLLLIDDNPVNVELLEDLLRSVGYTDLLGLIDPEQALAVCDHFQPDLILLDLHMPGRSGYEVLADLHDRIAGPDNLPVLVITADTGTQARYRALEAGARDFITKPFDTVELELRVRTHLATRQLQGELRRHNRELDAAVRERTHELDQARLESLMVLATVAEYHDDETHSHTRRVGELAALLGRRLGLDLTYIEMLRDAAPLHDIGKIAIPDAILGKPGALSSDEWTVMKRHAEIGASILARSSSPVLSLAREIASTHHERWDGSGYPAGLVARGIPLPGRIAATADVLDALTHVRPYKPAWTLDEALAEISRGSGVQFDPEVVCALQSIERSELAGIVLR